MGAAFDWCYSVSPSMAAGEASDARASSGVLLPHRGNMKKAFLLTGFLMAPIAIVAGLILLVVNPSREIVMREPGVGAGAGATGGANAIGEMLAGHKANRSVSANTALEAEHAENAEHAEHAEAAKEHAAADDAPNMVQPETLKQGFILIVEDKAKKATLGSPIYLAGTINNWNPGDRAYRLEPQSDMKWRLELNLADRGLSGPMEFKFARGSWKLEELDEKKGKVPNRSLPKVDISKLAPGERPQITLVVHHWGDEIQGNEEVSPFNERYRTIKPVSGTIKRLELVGGGGPAIGMMRDAFVWLPEGYDDDPRSGKSYPVLYMHDGQNLFADGFGSPRGWNLDKIAGELIKEQLCEPFIVVGLPNSGAARMSEYLPVDALPNVAPGGAEYLQFLVQQVKPRVDRTFNVRTDAKSTMIGGSSLGAAIAVYAATQYPEVFGGVLAESLPLATGKANAWDNYFDGPVRGWPERWYLGMGGKELGSDPANAARNKQYVDLVNKLKGTLNSKPVTEGGRRIVHLEIDDEANHNEEAWSKRLRTSLQVMFPGPKSKFPK